MLERGFQVCCPSRDIFHTMASTTPVLKQTSLRSERLSLLYSRVKHWDFKCPKYLFKICHIFSQVIPWKKSHTWKTLPEHFRMRLDSSSFVKERNTQQSKESEKQRKKDKTCVSALIASLTIFSPYLTNLMKEHLLDLLNSQAKLPRKHLL